MAHQRDIPISFTFRTERRKWEAYSFVRAEPALDPGADVLGLLPQLTAPRRRSLYERLTKPPKTNVLIRLHGHSGSFPRRFDTASYKVYAEEISEHLDRTLRARSLGSEAPESLTTLLVAFPRDKAPVKESNPWKMRDEFLRLEESNEALLGFLNRWGPWNFGSLDVVEPTDTALRPLVEPRPMAVLPFLVWERRKALKEGMLGKPDVWLAENASLSMAQRRTTYPYFAITDHVCSKAIETTITLDHLRETKWRKCARPDCENIFTAESAHGQKYCRQYCGHLESLRRNRAKARNAKDPATKKDRSVTRQQVTTR